MDPNLILANYAETKPPAVAAVLADMAAVQAILDAEAVS